MAAPARLRAAMPNLMTQMLLRASNGVGYTNYPDNVVRSFVLQAAETGAEDGDARTGDGVHGVRAERSAKPLKTARKRRSVGEKCKDRLYAGFCASRTLARTTRDDHSSGRALARALKPPTRSLAEPGRRLPIWCCSP